MILVLTLLLQIAPPPSPNWEARLDRRSYTGAGGLLVPYRLFIPERYDARKSYPLVVYLHGGGGVGEDNVKQLRGGNAHMVELFVKKETQATFPAFVLVPQASSPGWLNNSLTMTTPQLTSVPAIIESLASRYSIDRTRIYAGGQSLGGFGTLALIGANPDLFAAAFSLCGGGDPAQAPRLAKVPLWLFHGAEDRIVPVKSSRGIVEAVRRARGIVRYTEYPSEGHVLWQRVAREKNLLPWLFAQRRVR